MQQILWELWNIKSSIFVHLISAFLPSGVHKLQVASYISIFWPLNSFAPLSTKGPQIAYERSFRWKLAHFRYLCQVGGLLLLLHHSICCSQPCVLMLFFQLNAWMSSPVHPQSNALPSHVKITVSRQTLFEDSFQQVRVLLMLNCTYNNSFQVQWWTTAYNVFISEFVWS